MFVDTHAHYDDSAFDEDRHETLMRNKEYVHFIVNAAQDLKTTDACIELANTYNFVYATCGIHPHNANSFSEEVMEQLYKRALDDNVVAIGETGLDFHYDFSPREIQVKSFRANINLAREVKKPVVIHSREATEETLRILKEERVNDIGGVLHCFTGSFETALEANKLDLYYSIGGVVTFKNAKKIVKALDAIPNDRLMLETDAPYMTPVPYRGRRNESMYLSYVARKIAEIKGMDYEELVELTNINAKRFFVYSAQA